MTKQTVRGLCKIVRALGVRAGVDVQIGRSRAGVPPMVVITNGDAIACCHLDGAIAYLTALTTEKENP